jgi:catechol 2,3-dioxygenase-like lactoylglutathione lyase family enzyme
MIKIGSIVIRVENLEAQAAFWAAALEYAPRGPEGGDSDDFVLLRPRSGGGPNVSLDQHRSALPIPPRIHLDLYTDDQEGEVERLLAIGATRHPRTPGPEEDFVVLEDPEGNLFCVVDTRPPGLRP